MENILEVNNLYIDYKIIKSISYRKYLRYVFKREPINKDENIKIFSAVRNVSFNLEKGKCLGIVGANGSGKSTILRAIADIYVPDKGTILKYSEKTALLSLGVGFQTRLSGRENIILSGLSLGFTKKEILDLSDAIIEFSELGEFIDKPVKTYSSGMYSKLAFSISVMLKCDLLLIDEVLSVGDMRFKQKSFNKLKQIIMDDNQSVIIVSHAEGTIKSLCDRVLWLDRGEVKMFGDTDEVLLEYKNFMLK